MNNKATENREVILQEITEETLTPFLKMNVQDEQKKFVAPNAVSIAQAYFSNHAWFRGIYAGDEPVGFVMLHDEPEKSVYYVWRFMIAAEHQRKGYGYKAMELVIDHVCNRPNATELLLSHVPGEGSAGSFYEKLGFVYTGEEEDGELIMKLSLEK